MPKVSVLMPVYNTPESYFREAVRSILAQSFSDFDLDIRDDGSPAVSHIRDMARSFADPRIRFFENGRNLGISATRNALLETARGDYAAVADHDDVFMPERLQKQADFLDANLEVGVVGGAYCLVRGLRAKKERLTPQDGRIVRFPPDNATLEELLLLDYVVAHPAAMIRKKILTDSGVRYEEAFSPAEDYALWCRLLGKTRFANLPDVLILYRDHGGNTTHIQSKKMEEAGTRACSIARADHPDLWFHAQKRIVHEKRYRLFGRLPLLKVRTQGKKSVCLLFDRLPILRVTAGDSWRCPL